MESNPTRQGSSDCVGSKRFLQKSIENSQQVTKFHRDQWSERGKERGRMGKLILMVSVCSTTLNVADIVYRVTMLSSLIPWEEGREGEEQGMRDDFLSPEKGDIA